MKYERKSPYADGFNDIYTVAGVDADDVWARKRLLLGGDGGSGGAGESDTENAGLMGGFEPDSPTSPGPAGSFSSDQEAANEAAAEAQAQAEAQGEMDAYAAQVALGPVAQAFNFISPIDITKTHDQYGRGVYGLEVSVPGVVGGLIGGPMGMAIGTLGPVVGRGLGIETSVNVGPQGITTGFSTPTGIESAIGNAIGMDMSPGGLGSIGVGPGGSQDSATGTTGGTTTGTQGGVNDGIGGLDTSGNSDPAFEATDLSSDTMLGRTLVETDLDPGGDASAITPVPINTSAAPAGIFQVTPTTRPLAYAPSPSPFFLQPNFNPFAVPPLGFPTQTAPFAQPMRYNGAVNSGIGSLVSIR
jgi:hypothetical protein